VITVRIILAAAAADPQYGWGKLVALLVAVALFWLGSQAHQRWLSTRPDHSPTGQPEVSSGVKPQINSGSDTTSDTTPRGAVAVRKPLDEFVAQQVGKRPTSEIVREAQRRFRASKSTVLRTIKKVSGGAGVKP
jgi:hypothetical protein